MSNAEELAIDLVALDREVRTAARVRERGELIYERADPDVESRADE